MLLNCDAIDPDSTKAGNAAEIEIAYLFAQGIPVEPENFSRLDLIATGPGQRGGDQRRFEIVEHAMIEPDLRVGSAKRAKEIGDRALHRSVEAVPGDLARRRRDAFPSIVDRGRRREQRRRPDAEFGFDQRLPDHILGIEGGKATREIFELTYVPRPEIAPQTLHRRRLDRLERKALRRAALEEGAHEIGDILRAFAQRREAERHDIEAKEQILAKSPLLDGEAEILVRRGDDPDVGLDRRPAADGGVFSLLQHAKKSSLSFHRHIADFVEKQGPAFRLFKASYRAGGRAGEGALFVAEE